MGIKLLHIGILMLLIAAAMIGVIAAVSIAEPGSRGVHAPADVSPIASNNISAIVDPSPDAPAAGLPVATSPFVTTVPEDHPVTIEAGVTPGNAPSHDHAPMPPTFPTIRP